MTRATTRRLRSRRCPMPAVALKSSCGFPPPPAIPSSNTVKVTFEDDEGVAVVTTVAHDVPEGIIKLSDHQWRPRVVRYRQR